MLTTQRLAIGAVVAAAVLGPPIHGVQAARYPERHARRNVTWHGGPVQRHPRVYIIFWGPRWATNGLHRAAGSVAVRTIRALRGSSYQRILTQYYDRAGHITDDVRLAGLWHDRSTPRGDFTANDRGVDRAAKEVAHAISVNGWANSLNAQYLLLVQSSEPTGYCGDDVNRALAGRPLIFSIIPWLGPRGTGCSSGSSLGEAYGSTLSHEYAEMATDPLANGWARGNPAGHNHEIADLCNLDGMVRGLWMQRIWSNRLRRCAV